MSIHQIKDRIFKLLERVGLLAEKASDAHLKAEEEAKSAEQPASCNDSKESPEVNDISEKKEAPH